MVPKPARTLAAAAEARRANQRLDTLEGRVQQLETYPGRNPRG